MTHAAADHVGASDVPAWRVERHDVLPQDLLGPLRALYIRSFDPLRSLAAARHVLTEAEFAEEMADEAVSKYVALGDDGEPVGLTTFTLDLSTVTWVSADFYARRWPEQAATGRLYYLGYTLADPAYHRRGVFDAMLTVVTDRAIADDAIIAWDMCSFNVDTARLADGIAALLSGRSTPPEVVDTQRYYAADFSRSTR
ncbi:hypothetical protein [Nocardioides sp. CFH 31398]|uniref:hypothetical protein n=1 Tax=Nocardioides sp. CFH 31398 TaxID=2919579 RepID=UPI001F069B9C|nr:hypothetical protein [Nocardioides sp. CFH 31398]MCH1865971.1 hypothetical protein [Nocardioides sp. CFH 31398]